MINLDLKDLKQTSQPTETITNPHFKKLPFYCEIGALFAQGFIYKIGFDYYYKEMKFESINKLSKHVEKEILKTNKSTRQWINDTVQNTGIKNFYASNNRMQNIIEYCEIKGIEIKPDFKPNTTY
ncbi:hypothetical protein ACFFU9_07895 [Mariniflexile ostreae]|uniref:Uncharacterized protein n=1 Tax=Mariniflexile ostreae TaxID=1520892 RepID=A0ABV5FC45_9FLAO